MSTFKIPLDITKPVTPPGLPPRIKVSYPKAMTIALGFICQDGIVLAADTQLTASGSHKGYACKLFRHTNFNTLSAAVTYAGYPSFVDSFNNRFRDEMHGAERQWPVTGSLVRDLVSAILHTFPDADCDKTELLCGVSFPNNEQKLYKTNGKLVSEVEEYAYIGIGDSSAVRHIFPLITKDGIRSTQQAALVGTYLIRVAKMYIDGCGGDSDLWILRPSGALEYCSNQVPSVEQHQAMTEHFFSAVVSGLMLGMNEVEFEDRIARMCQRLRDEKTELMRFFRPARLSNPR
jgi:hypothetical protein